MDFLDWHKSFSIGHQYLDALHKELVSLLNAVYEEMLKNESETKVNESIDKLTDRLPEIYFEEEKILLEKGYSEISEHSQMHAKIGFLIIELKKKYHEEDHVVAMDYLIEISKKIDSHFKEEDKKYTYLF